MADDKKEKDFFEDIEDGKGCTGIWERLSKKRKREKAD
jgi:hypothetical protein